MTSNAWIRLLAYEPRARHAADRRREEKTANHLASVRVRILAELRCAIALDIEAFLRADGDESDLTCANGRSAQGFVVSTTNDRAFARSLAVDLNAGTLRCRYDDGRRSPVHTGFAPEVLAIEMGRDGATLSFWDGGVDRRVATVDALSAFLLAPLLVANRA